MTKSNTFSEIDISQIATYQSGVTQAAAHRLTNRIVSNYLLSYGLTAMQWFIIGLIYDSGETGLSLTNLTHLLDTSLPYITNTVKLLESKRVIIKKVHASDSRTKIVTIAPAYRSIVEEIEQGLRSELRTQLYKNDRISRDELQTYIHVLYKIVESSSPQN